VLDTEANFPDAFCIHHRTISGALGTIRESFQNNPDLCRRGSDAVDADLNSIGILAGLLLTASLTLNPGGIVLFSSRVPAHIIANAHFAHDPASAARVRRLLEFLAEQSIVPR
jgi:hypothetical protein